MRLFKWGALLIGFAMPLSASAQPSTQAKACMELPTAAQSGCLEKLANAADAKLNETYRRAVSVIEKSDSRDAAGWKSELKKAQLAWIAFRDTDCGALIGYEWNKGTGMGAATEACILEKTEQRTRDLMQRYIERQ
jgi:uncharacterized protein YecT (DUF1311 family)